jgi:hypothetical protein
MRWMMDEMCAGVDDEEEEMGWFTRVGYILLDSQGWEGCEGWVMSWCALYARACWVQGGASARKTGREV